MNAELFKNDISVETARAAHYGTSFVPDKRATQERDGYAETLAGDYQTLLAYADTPGKLEQLQTEFERYRAGYRKRTLAYLGSRSRLVSTMIAGPSNFPAARMNKRGEISHKRLTELLEFRAKALKAIKRTLSPELRPIMAGDADAVDRLEEKIREAERLQEAMKEANKIVRQKPKGEATPEKMAALMTLGIKQDAARQLFVPDFCGRIGFADFELTNNGANIRRMQARLASIAINQAAEETTIKGTVARFEDCPPDNRVRLFFPGKPAAEIRTTLKSGGFRWSPTIGCWQAYRHNHTIELAKKVAGVTTEQTTHA